MVKKDCMGDYFCCKNDADSKLVEFTNTERVDAAVVREKSAIYKRIDRYLHRKSMGTSSPEFQFPMMAGGLHNSSSELGKQIQFLSWSVVISSSVATGTSVTTTSPSSLSTGASVSSIDWPPRSCSSQNSSGPSQPRTPFKLNVHAKEFIPSNHKNNEDTHSRII